MKTLNSPDWFDVPALYPRAVLFSPLVVLLRAWYPTATWWFPVTLVPASYPMSVFWFPDMFALPAPYPKQLFSVALVPFCKEYTPTAVFPSPELIWLPELAPKRVLL